MNKYDFEDFLETTKDRLKGINPLWAVCGLVLIIYLLERQPVLAGFVIFGSLAAFFFKRYGVIILSVIADLADYAGAAVPIVGDFLDIFIVIIQVIKYGAQGFVGLLELIPFVDLLPILAINASIAQYKKNNE
jgi:hypothetical protein